MQNTTTGTDTPKAAYIAVNWNSKGLGFRATVNAYVKTDSPNTVQSAMVQYLQNGGFSTEAAQNALSVCTIYRLEKIGE